MLAVAHGPPAYSSNQQSGHFVEITKGAFVLSRPDPIAEFRLLRHDKRPFDNSALKGKWSFLFFGFTNCPDACPATMAVFKEVDRLLGRQPQVKQGVQFVLVSVDPDRDTPERLKEFVTQFNPTFLGVTGERKELARLSESVGVVYAQVPGKTPKDYLMDHSSAVLLTNPEGKLHAVFAAPHVPEKITEAFLKIRR
jgi:protein SCO1/2